jgi:recombinase
MDQTIGRTTRSPRPWLIAKPQVGGTIEVSPKEAAAVLWMFKASETGLSDNEITKRMPSQFVPWSKSGKWSRLIVSRTLRDRTVLGGRHKGRYFPPIIELELFNSAKTARKERSLLARGRRDRSRRDQFVNLLKCDDCGKRMKFRSAKVDDFYVCTNKVCPGRGIKWLYRDFVASYDAFVGKSYRRGLAMREPGDENAIEFEMKFIEKQLAARQREVEVLEEQISEIEKKLAERRKEKRTRRKAAAVIDQPDDLNRSRQARITQLVRGFVSEFLVLPAGTTPRMEERLEVINKASFVPDIKGEIITSVKELENRPMFRARFKDGRVAMIIPSKKNPGRIEFEQEDDGAELESEGAESESKVRGPQEQTPGDLPPVTLIGRFSVDSLPNGTLTIKSPAVKSTSKASQ